MIYRTPESVKFQFLSLDSPLCQHFSHVFGISHEFFSAFKFLLDICFALTDPFPFKMKKIQLLLKVKE